MALKTTTAEKPAKMEINGQTRQNLPNQQQSSSMNPEQTVTEVDEDDDGEGEILDDEVNTTQIYFNKL